jgi:hypothetical protein
MMPSVYCRVQVTMVEQSVKSEKPGIEQKYQD